jgi:L-threonylcarbamoyladenylate synthase
MIMLDGSETHAAAAAIIKAGGIVAFRTDTFYGLGVDPFNTEALGKLRTLKSREAAKPVLVVLSDADIAERFMIGRTEIFDALCAKLWPGALTLVVAARAEVPVELTAGSGTVGVRLPADKSVRAFVRTCGGALTATSANHAGEPPARTAVEVAAAFPAGLSLIVDGGAARREQPSTVLDISGAQVRLIRAGVVPWTEIARAIAEFQQRQ